LLTNKITKTDEIADEISKFLKQEEGGSIEEAHKKVLPVTSSQKHEKNREILKPLMSQKILLSGLCPFLCLQKVGM